VNLSRLFTLANTAGRTAFRTVRVRGGLETYAGITQLSGRSADRNPFKPTPESAQHRAQLAGPLAEAISNFDTQAQPGASQIINNDCIRSPASDAPASVARGGHYVVTLSFRRSKYNTALRLHLESPGVRKQRASEGGRSSAPECEARGEVLVATRSGSSSRTRSGCTPSCGGCACARSGCTPSCGGCACSGCACACRSAC